jgi:hypothetical protein
MIIHHKSTTCYPQGNGQAKSTHKTLGKILAKLINVNRNNWDVMFFTTLWAHQTTYKVTTQFSPFELVYGTQPIMLAEFMVPTKIIRDVPTKDLNQTIHVRMEDLIRLDEECWCVGENINHIQLLQKENWDEKRKLKNIYDGDLILWLPKSTKIKGRKF